MHATAEDYIKHILYLQTLITGVKSGWDGGDVIVEVFLSIYYVVGKLTYWEILPVIQSIKLLLSCV